MNITMMKTLLEIQAIQSIGNSQTNIHSLTGNNGSVFTEMLTNIVSSAGHSNNAVELLNNASEENFPADRQSTFGLSAFMLNNSSSYIPSTYYNSLMPSTTGTNPVLNNSTNNDFIKTTIFNNVLAGANQYSDLITKASQTYGIPEKLIASIMKQESNFNSNAVSSAGATGLMQLMPGTAKYLGVKDSRNPEQNIMGGTKYLKQMLNQFGNDMNLALAAYNAGPGNVKKYGGIPPFKETQNYVKKVLNYYQT